MASKQPRTDLTWGEKETVINLLESGEKQVEIAKQFGVNKSTVSRIWKNREAILEQIRQSHSTVAINRKRKREGKVPDIEQCLFVWFNDILERGGRLSGDLSLSECLTNVLHTQRLQKWSNRFSATFALLQRFF